MHEKINEAAFKCEFDQLQTELSMLQHPQLLPPEDLVELILKNLQK